MIMNDIEGTISSGHCPSVGLRVRCKVSVSQDKRNFELKAQTRDTIVLLLGI